MASGDAFSVAGKALASEVVFSSEGRASSSASARRGAFSETGAGTGGADAALKRLLRISISAIFSQEPIPSRHA